VLDIPRGRGVGLHVKRNGMEVPAPLSVE